MSDGRVVGAGRSPGLGRRVSRRGVLGLVGRLGLGVGGAALAGLSAVVMRAPTVAAQPANRGDTFIAAVDERQHSPSTVEVRYVTDHLSGPRGAALTWGLEEFARRNPITFVRLEPAAAGNLAPISRDYQGERAHVALISQADFVRYRGTGHFMRINDLLPQFGRARWFREVVAPETVTVRPGQFDLLDFDQHYFVPDAFTDDGLNHSFPQSAAPKGLPYPDQFGLPFELSISGFLANISLAEDAGVRLPDSEYSWTWDDWSEWDAMMTDPETGTFGTWSQDDYAGQYMPQMYTNGLKKPFDDGLTKTMFDQPKALEAWTYLIDKVVEQKSAPTVGRVKPLAGEYGDPFSAGKIGIWPTDQVSVTGNYTPRIKDRFEWTLLPEVVTPGRGPPGRTWSMRANLVSANAEADGNAEQAVEFVQFLAGPEYPGRVGIHRGHVPVHKAALDAPESLVWPPDGMKWLKVYADRTDNRSPYPFANWTEWLDGHRTLARKGWTGELAPAQALEACQAWGVRRLSQYDGPRPYVREPVYA